MNIKFKYITGRLFLIPLVIMAVHVFSGCNRIAATINPEAISQSLPVDPSGTLYPQIISVYPSDSSTNIPVDTDIVIVFSKAIDSSSIAGNITISGATLDDSSPTLVSGGRTVVLAVSSGNLSYGTSYTVAIGTGVTDTNGNALSAGGSFSFTTAASTASSIQPRVISDTRYPADTSTGISISQSYVEVTFTEEVTNVTASTFTIVDGSSVDVHSGSPLSSDNKTWRLNIDTALAEYSQTYTVTLSTAIYKLGTPSSTLTYTDVSELSWTYTTESDPATDPLAVNDIWVSSVTDTTAVINFTTSRPVAPANCYAVYSTSSGVTTANTHFQESTSATLATAHTVTVTGLSPFTRYYFRGGINTSGGTPVEILSATEINFYTAANSTNNSVLANTANDEDGLVLLQTNGTQSYAFWVNNGSDIYGQCFTTAALWGAGGNAISTTGGQNGIIAINNGFTDAILIYNDSDNLYSKMVYNNAGAVGFRWGGGSASQGVNLGIAIKSGSTYSACLVHERPDIITTGVADMPNDGDAANLLFDADVDFSAYGGALGWLDVNDWLITDIADATDITWTRSAIYDQSASPYDVYPYVLYSANTTGLGTAISGYYIVDADVTITGNADYFTATNQLCSATTNLMTVVAGDIIRIDDGQWGIASSDGAWNNGGSYWYVNIDRALTSLDVTDTFIIYTIHAGPFTSEAVTNPLWDTAPSTLYNPGVTVFAGDYIVNENTNSTIATYATVSAIDLSLDTDYALRLSSDIMNNGDIYSIVRLPSGFTFKGVGYSTSVATDFNLTDSFSPFGSAAAGDIVFNIDQDLSAMVTSASAGSLTITADIFNNTNEKAIAFTKRGFLVAFVDTSNFIRARVYNIATGAFINSAFNVCTTGINSEPVTVSDGAGNAIIFYEKYNTVSYNNDIYVKKVSAKGEFMWASPADTAGGAGITVLTGYTIVQALPDRAIGETGGAYLLAVNTAGNAFRLVRVRGTDGSTTYNTGDVTGYDPQMVVDTDATLTGVQNRAIIVYRNTHTIGVNYYHVEIRAYHTTGLQWSNLLISDTSAVYNCYKPSITMAGNSTAADEIFVSWFDGRYFNPSGYSIFAQNLSSAGVAQWTANGELESMPGSRGYDYPMTMGLLYYNDGGTPFGLLPIWLDYRTNSTTGTDIYYQLISN